MKMKAAEEALEEKQKVTMFFQKRGTPYSVVPLRCSFRWWKNHILPRLPLYGIDILLLSSEKWTLCCTSYSFFLFSLVTIIFNWCPLPLKRRLAWDIQSLDTSTLLPNLLVRLHFTIQKGKQIENHNMIRQIKS